MVKATEVGPTLENSHPFVYELELVLGGKLHDVFRADLLYTTATQEGMLDDSRGRRKRKQQTLFDADPMSDKPKKEKGGKKKKAAKKGKASAAADKPTTAAKKRPAGDKGKVATKKPKPNTPEANATSSSAAAGSQVVDLFERHRKEFERSLGRLEKADVYNFFGTVVPPEFEEVYTREGADSSISSIPDNGNSAQHDGLTSRSQSPVPGTQESEKKPKKKKKKKESDEAENKVIFPSTPPFNFVVIRRRMELGRYIFDRVAIENEKRIDLMTPYWISIGRKNIKRNPKKSLIPVLHPKGIDWDLFRKDVFAMCDSALVRYRDDDDGDVGPGTLIHAVGKIKDLMEQIYEKFGRRHYIEMAAANDRHRFSLAMDQTTNNEAAVQGKWKRDGKKMLLPGCCR